MFATACDASTAVSEMLSALSALLGYMGICSSFFYAAPGTELRAML